MYDIYVKLRDAKGVSDYRVAKDTGIGRTCLYEWGTRNNGKGAVSADKLKKLADYFGVSVDVFFKD